GRFSLRSEALAPGKNGVLHLVPLHANGDVADWRTREMMRYSYHVAEDGTPDLQSIQTRQALEPVVEAIEQGNDALARRRAGRVRGELAGAIAKALTDAATPEQTPAEYRGKAEHQPITMFKPDAVSVGWARPTFNRLPEASVLLESSGKLFATGIYAHAPARHEYSLGGQWESFKGNVGIATGHSGSVRFEIKGDGRQLWQSSVVRPDEIVSFKVDVKEVNQLELITSPTDDGTSNDWSLWLEPQLVRSR
ncbi:MAG TPA: NPCBM/NEW2 domain-containing protein, partial [Lacipirellula sp.]